MGLGRWIGCTVLIAGLAACASSPAETRRPDCDPTTAPPIDIELDVEVGVLAPMAAGRVLVHVPPCVDPAGVPVVWLFHGGGLGPESWIDPPVDALGVLDELSLDGEVADVVVAMPGGSDGGHFFAEHALVPTLDAVEAWRGAPLGPMSLAGFSAGGLTAGEVVVADGAPAFDRLGLYGTIWSAGLSRDLAGMDPGDLEILADTGEDDGGGELFVPGIEDAAATAGIPMTVERHPGGHDLDFVASRMADWWRWLAPPDT